MFVDESPFADQGLTNFDLNVALPRHRWYSFKEGFSEALVRHAVADNGVPLADTRANVLQNLVVRFLKAEELGAVARSSAKAQ